MEGWRGWCFAAGRCGWDGELRLWVGRGVCGERVQDARDLLHKVEYRCAKKTVARGFGKVMDWVGRRQRWSSLEREVLAPSFVLRVVVRGLLE